MNRFEYARPTTIAEALEAARPAGRAAAGSEPCEYLAGGTDLLSLMKDFVVEPKRVVSLTSIAELRGVTPTGDGGLRIGAMTTLDELLANVLVRKGSPALAQAAEGIRSPQLRAMGTVGGELLQRPRCWYFRHGHGLLALDPKGESLVVRGDHRYHAVFDNAGPAKFVSPSSLAPALVALGAKLEVWSDGASANGKAANGAAPATTTIAVADLYRTPKSAAESEFTLAPGSIVAAIVLGGAATRSATYEVRPRQGLDWPLAAASVALTMDGSQGSKVKSATVVLGHVAPRPWVASGAAKALAGQELDEKTIAAAAEAAVAGATPLAKNAYKVELAKVATRRALAAAAGRAV
jgi:xanthine dehydrogenase YagS FAD-binding subunit